MEILAIDIETTGLEPRKDKVLELACVHFEDSIPPWGGSPSSMGVAGFHALIIPETKIEADLHLMAMHSKTGLWGRLKGGETLLKERKSRLVEGCPYSIMYADQLYDTFTKWLAASFSKQNRHNVVGKNFAAFDLQFLITLDSRFETLFSRRVADPSMFFYRNRDRHLPDTQTCIDRAKEIFRKGYKKGNKVHVNILGQLNHLESCQHVAEDDARLAYLLYCIGLYRQRGEI
jgi:DNA polymerase III epsilon subunit-like protein